MELAEPASGLPLSMSREELCLVQGAGGTEERHEAPGMQHSRHEIPDLFTSEDITF